MRSSWSVVSVYDGDTFHVEGTVTYEVVADFKGLDLDAAVVVREKVRLAHCDAAELADPGGRAARDAVKSWLAAQPFAMVGFGRDKYGRWLADCERGDGTLLSAFVLALPGSVPMSLPAQLAAD